MISAVGSGVLIANNMLIFLITFIISFIGSIHPGPVNLSVIQTTLQKLTDRIIDYKIKRNIYDHNSLSAGHIVSIPLNNINVHALKERLQNNKVVVSFRGTSIRISPHVYNDVDDIDKLLYCLQG